MGLESREIPVSFRQLLLRCNQETEVKRGLGLSHSQE